MNTNKRTSRGFGKPRSKGKTGARPAHPAPRITIARPRHIVVCIKAVMTRAPGDGIIRSADTAVLNPFDRPALAVAFALAKEWNADVTTLSMGPDSTAFVLFETLAMGADRGILLSDPGLADSDTLATSTTLAAALRKLAPVDLVLFGTRTSDSDTGQVGTQTAVMCDIPIVTGVTAIHTKSSGLRIERYVDEFLEIYDVSLPAAVTVHPSAAVLQDTPVAAIEQAFEEGRVEFWNLDDLGLHPALTGTRGSPTTVLSMNRISRERKCRFLEGSMDEMAEALISHIRELGLIG